jgi:hypothetical protein
LCCKSNSVALALWRMSTHGSTPFDGASPASKSMQIQWQQ